jgi:hypothetical protein
MGICSKVNQILYFRSKLSDMRTPNLKNEIVLKYLSIFLILNGVHYLYKFYDRSFTSLWQYDLRGIFFHLFFVLFGLIVWETGIRITNHINQITKKHFNLTLRFAILGVVLFLYCIGFTALYGTLYYNLFFVLIHQEKLWADYAVLDRDLMVMMIVISLIIIGFHSFIFYFKNWQEAEVMAERLQKENIRSQFEVLKHQIEPHFFFNSLSVLNSLVYKDANLAGQYIAQLSKIYRYVLDSKDETVVSLEQELDFLNAYIFLMTVRHNDGIRFSLEISTDTRKYTFVPKNSLQMLAENAVKHNRFSKENPLLVRITEDDDFLRVINNLNRRELIEGSSGIGLENIRRRYELISEKRVELEETSFTFCVKLPKLKKGELKSIDI